MTLPRASLRQFFRSIDYQIAYSSRSSTPAIKSISRQNSALGVSSRSLLFSSSKPTLSQSQYFRTFSSSSRNYKQWSETKSRFRGRFGVKIFNISPRQAIVRGVIFIITGVALVIYIREERARVERKRIANATKGIGKPKVGGPFNLVDQDGRPFSNEDMKDKYALLYFGYTHCPDICPDELDKMSEMIDMVKKACGDIIMPIMISCDPARDPPSVLKEYLKEFHPDIIGLTGQYEDIKQTCKVYRVYFSTPPDVKPGQDYMVDHSIYFFLMDPEGDFIEVLGRNFDAKGAAKVIIDHVKDWDGFLDESPRRRGNVVAQRSPDKAVAAA